MNMHNLLVIIFKLFQLHMKMPPPYFCHNSPKMTWSCCSLRGVWSFPPVQGLTLLEGPKLKHFSIPITQPHTILREKKHI